MKHVNLIFSLIILYITIVLSLTSCSSKDKSGRIEIDPFIHQDTLINDFAEAFQIIYHDDYTKVNIIDPSNQSVIKQYTIHRGNSSAYNSFSHNLNRVVAISTTYIGMMRKLGLEDNIKGVASFKYLCHPLNQSNILEVGEIGMKNTELFLKAEPDIILYSGFNVSESILSKFEQANLKTFLIYEWKETHPLGRAEWIKVFGVLFQKEKEANAIYEQIKSDYYSITEQLKHVEHETTVFAGAYFGDVFNVPAGESYMAQLFKDVNVDYVYAHTKGTGSLSLSLEEVITKNKNTEFWLNANADSREKLLQQSEKFNLLEVTKTGKLYSYFEKNSCFWENAPIEPNKLLEDLGKIFHPDLFKDTELTYYRQLKD